MQSLIKVGKYVAAAALGALATQVPELGLPPELAVVAASLVSAALLWVKRP
jgi:predicted cobalt transporter CbtA